MIGTMQWQLRLGIYQRVKHSSRWNGVQVVITGPLWDAGAMPDQWEQEQEALKCQQDCR